MADTIRERIISAFAARAQSLSSLPVERVQRSIGDSNARFVSIWDGEDQTLQTNYGQQQLQFPIAVECIFKFGGDNPSVSANAVIGETISTLLAGDRTFGGLASSMAYTAASPGYPQDGSDYVTVSIIFIISYTIVSGDPYTLPVY